LKLFVFSSSNYQFSYHIKSMEKENQKSSIEDIENTEKEVANPEDQKEDENKEFSFEEKYKDLEDKLIRSYAEIENQRRRFEKEKDEAFQYGGMSLARESLNLTDNLERSKLSILEDQNLDQKSKDKIIEHLNIIYKDIVSIFKKNQIEEITAIGEKLDPNRHQAMMEIEDAANEPGTVVQEIQKGYMLKDRLLRPSLVGVSKKPLKDEKKEKISEKKEEN
tara:strand:- start:4391 stop:5053 length:663 start_codon:yes stop_codon:yes gene_type:complete